MKTTALIFSILVFSSLSFARLSDGKAHWVLKGTQIVGSVDQGFHFNKDAPAALVVGENTIDAVKKQPKEFIFDASKVKNEVVSVNFYVCDDKNTVCESHEEKYQIVDGKIVAADAVKEKAPAPAVAEKSVKSTAVFKKNKHGFYEDNLEAALKLAAKEKKLLLVDFNAPWCPSCIRLETEAFGEKSFQKATEKFIKVSLNIDKAANKALEEQYGVKAIPTLVVMNAKGEEIGRSIDYKPVPTLVKDLDSLLKGSNTSLATLQKKAESGDITARKALADQAYAALNYQEVVKWLSPLKENSLLLANAEIRAAEAVYNKDKKNSESYQKTIEKWIAVYPHSLDAIEWRPDLMKVLKGDNKEASAAVKKVGKDNVTEIEALLASEKDRQEAFAQSQVGNCDGFEKAELLMQMTETLKLMDDKKKSDETAAVLAKEVKNISLSEQRPGQVLAAMQYMKAANMKPEMQAWIEKLVQTYPDTDVYVRLMARFYVRNNQYDKALPYAQKAAAMQSDTALINLKFLAEIHKNLKQNKEAGEIIDKALALPEVSWEKNKETLAELKEMKKSL